MPPLQSRSHSRSQSQNWHPDPREFPPALVDGVHQSSAHRYVALGGEGWSTPMSGLRNCTGKGRRVVTRFPTRNSRSCSPQGISTKPKIEYQPPRQVVREVNGRRCESERVKSPEVQGSSECCQSKCSVLLFFHRPIISNCKSVKS